MASIIRIKRSEVAGNPSVLAAGELAYSALTDNGSNGGDRLYIGIGTETTGDAANHYVIGGKFFTDRLDHTAGTLTANSAIVVDGNSKIDNLLVDNLQLNGSTLSSTDTNGNILITPNGTGKTVVTNLHIGDASTSIAEFIYDTVGGAITGGTGITITNNDAGNTSTVSITNTGVAAASYGSATAIPVLTINAQGQITAASTATISTALSIAGDTGTDSVSLGVDTLTFVGGTGITTDVTNNTVTIDIDATVATKAYVDAVVTGLDVKQSVRVATTAALTATYANGTLGVGATLTNSGTQTAFTIDSIVGVLGDRVLVKDQGVNSPNNGIYTITTVGTSSTNWVLTRSLDADQTSEVTPGAFTFVEEGTTNADSGWVLTTNGAITIGTTGINWSQFSGAGQITAGDGLMKSGNTIYAVGTANRITVNPDSIDIASTYVGQNTITTLGTVTTGTWNGAVVLGQYGGTGVANTGKTITLGGNLTTSGAFATTLTVTNTTNVTLPTTGTLATLAGSEALTNKTVNGLNITTTTGTLTVVSGGTLATAGAFSTTLTSTAATNVTLPTTGTLATLAGTESLSNKTITASSFAGSVAATTLSASGLVALTNTTDAGPLGTAAVVLSGGLSVAKKLYVGTNLVGSGPATSTLDGFNLDGGTY